MVSIKQIILILLVLVLIIKLNTYLYALPSFILILYFTIVNAHKNYKNLSIIMTFLSLLCLTFNLNQTNSLKNKRDTIYFEQVKTITQNDKLLKEADILSFKKEKQLVLNNFDKLKRATGAHIQLQNKDKATNKRNEKLKFNPVGWHNYKFYYGDGKHEAWLMHRGHLISYQFSGLNDEGRNLVPMTTWLNTGNFSGMDDTNIDSMLFYENKLSNWLNTFPDYWLDYKVTPIYQDNELIPRKIELKYIGLDKNGKLIPINIGGHSTQDKLGVSTVILENVSPNATIDYLTGTAKNTVAKYVVPVAPTPPVNPTPAEQTPPEQMAEDRIVYVANHGKSKAYWYSTSHMPSNTNMSKVVEMSESEALSLGKHHSKIE